VGLGDSLKTTLNNTELSQRGSIAVKKKQKKGTPANHKGEPEQGHDNLQKSVKKKRAVSSVPARPPIEGTPLI